VAASALALPVGVTTASALETQAFLLVHFLLAAFLVDVLVRVRVRPLLSAERPRPAFR
jgi:hypothetical protein